MREVHVVVPEGIDDPRRPSGGNVYDRRVCRELAELGWAVQEHRGGGAPGLASALAEVPDGGLVVVDGLLASLVPEVLRPEAERLRLVVLLHMPIDDPREAAALAAVSAVVATSQWTSGWLRDRYGLSGVRVVPPGVDAAELSPGTSSGGRLLSVGAVTPIKGQDLLMDALASIDDLAWSCEVVGALDIDAGFAAQVVGRKRHRVHFSGPLTDVAAAYARADVLVLTSRAESYGMVVTEALARGLPVISRDVGGVSEALGRTPDGTSPGLLVGSDDPRGLEQALRRWLGDPGERARLRAAAASRRRTLGGWSQTAAALSEVLTELSDA